MNRKMKFKTIGQQGDGKAKDLDYFTTSYKAS